MVLYNYMVQSVCVLGRQPVLGLAELESLYGADVVEPVAQQVAGVHLATSSVDFARLGGGTKLAEVLAVVPSSDWSHAEKELTKLAHSSALAVPTEGKFHLGLSAYGFPVSPAKLTALGLTLKKIIRSRGVSVRTVPNTEMELSTAQVYHNHLADEHGAELLVIRAHDNRIVIARTVAVQDIDSYTLRDRSRPKRDARVGMLPPKLAQTIINLAAGEIDSRGSTTILDPFCGTGVVLQEALLMGYNAYGTDIEPRMIDYSRANLDWFIETYKLQPTNYKLDPGDATSHAWVIEDEQSTVGKKDTSTTPYHLPPTVHIAAETYLGRPFTTVPPHNVLEQTISDVNVIVKKFLTNVYKQLAPGSRLCLAVPAWFMSDHRQPRHLAVLDSLSALGYERVEFKLAPASALIYRREGQIVGRELLVLTKR